MVRWSGELGARRNAQFGPIWGQLRLQICNQTHAEIGQIAIAIPRTWWHIGIVDGTKRDAPGIAQPQTNGDSTMQVQYGSHNLDIAKFHPNAIEAMVRRGISHYLGNEVASKVSGWSASQVSQAVEAFKTANPTKSDEATLAEVARRVEPSPEAKATKKAEFQAAAVQALLDGTVGQSNRGPKADPLEAEIEKLTRHSVLETLKANGIKAPKGDGVVSFADGTTRTMEQMVENRFKRDGDAITTQAKKNLAEREKVAAKAKADAAKRDTSQPIAAANLGL